MKLFRLLFLFTLATPAVMAEDLARRFESDVRVLASEEMEGRGLGTKGIEKAASWIEARLRQLGLRPAFNGSYRQKFDVKTGVVLADGNQISTTNVKTATKKNVPAADWTPLGFSSSGKFDSPVVFVGYGIEAPPLGYRELEGVDLKGKVALMLRYEPQEKDEGSPFDGRKPSRWSATRYKVLQARERGASAVIFVTGPLQDEGKDRVPVLKNDGPESAAGLPVLQVKNSLAQEWLKAGGIDLLQFQKDVDRDLRPRSRELPVRITGNVAVRNTFADAVNVAGVLPGRGALANEVVVLGAHYDHLGMGGERSMKPNVQAAHLGADDNASGTAAVLLAAERLRDQLRDVPSHRTVLIALFSAEESGLAGSGYMVANPPLPMDRVVAMVNLDMVGMLRDDKLMAFGSESAPEWRNLVERLGKDVKLNITASGDGYGPSDQTSFYAARIPVIHFFTGAHERYHTPEDRVETLNHTGGAKIVELTTNVVATVARGEVTPQYARIAAAPAMQGDSRGYGAYLGTVPDYSAMDATSGGVLLGDVRPGGPAELAGIKAGDRIVEMAETRIENLYDMTYALQDHKPGETIDVVVIRGGERKTLKATLGSRGGTPAVAPAQQPAAPAQPAPPAASPAPAHPGGAPAAGPAPAPAADFYDNRPGKDFVIKAGKPFTQTFEGEGHLTDIRRLTFDGDNAEAYFSPDGKKLIYQATVRNAGCDQQYTVDLATGETKLVSTGKGRTTCGYYRWPQGDRIIYGSTESGGAECPPRPDRSQGYVWPVYESFELYEANVDGSNPKVLSPAPGYDAEMTWCHRGGKKVFTSMRDGDLDLYEMDEAGNVRRLTDKVGYDGGAFYSPDCKEIVWRANYPTGPALENYRGLLAKGLVRPTQMELFVMNADGTDQRQITKNGAANFCPYFTRDGKKIIFASNVNQTGFEFDLWMVGKDGQNLERISTAPGFDGFPVFSPDGEFMVWSSSRADPDGRGLDLFIARWK
ncbi:MAG TPA: M20/M25/M40 family metallo-hydrolase [Thermoanaerobaculia bacterium]|nr:M20/M25/M40 family metallo-hydrolase [Thermoanaerobaculia bacterium]